MFIPKPARPPAWCARRAAPLAGAGITLLLASHPALSQDLGWRRTVDASGNVFFGSASTRLASLAAGANRADSALEIRSDVGFTYADSRPEDERRRVTARSSRLGMGLDWRPFERLSPFWFGSVESSLQQRIALRTSTGAGGKLTVWRQVQGDVNDDVSVSLALLHERTRALDPDSLTPPVATRVRWSTRFRVRRQLAPALRLTHTTFYQPAVDRLARYTVDTNTTLAAALREGLALTATLRDRYDSEARRRGASSNHDGQLLFGVRAAF